MNLDPRICPCGECPIDPALWECVKAQAAGRQGFVVTLYVEGPATQESAEALVRAMVEVALPGVPEGTIASVVPE